MGISYFGSITNFSPKGYCDADYAGNHDDRKSRTSYLFTLANGAMAWCGKRQTCSADSTKKAEFVVLAESVMETIGFDAYYPVLDFLKPILLLFSWVTKELYSW